MAVQQVRVQVNGTWHILTYNSSTGKYEKTITAPTVTSYNQSGHYYQLAVEATDDYGNVVTDNTSASARLVVKEVTAPVINISSPTSAAKLTNNKPPITFTIVDEASGSGVDATSIVLTIDGTITVHDGDTGMVRTSIANGYSYTYTPQTALSDGAHTIVANGTDYDGNVATQKSVTFTIDTIAPTLNITAPADNLKTNTATCGVIGQTNDTTSSPVTVTIKLNGTDQGAVTLDGSGNFNKSVTLAAGTNTIVIRSTDAAGKYTEITRTVLLNTIAPVISNIAVTPNPTNVGDSIVISCTVTDS